MIQIDNKVVSLQILEQKFCCNLAVCKGACCVEGDAGAPLDEEELDLIKETLPVVKDYLPEVALKEIEKQGYFVKNEQGEFETPLVAGKECVYTVFENGMALCGIEKAYREGKISFKKPISCHLYPIRISKSDDLEFLNFSYWNICDSAFTNGSENGIPVYTSVKEALVRKYGQEFYDTLVEVADEWEDYKKKKEKE
jgi:hypothetical protein